MKPVVKQKLSTLQDIINNAQSGGGGGTVDAYTKAEADAKFETITGAAAAYLSKTDAASTYLSKANAARMAKKIVVESTATTSDSGTMVEFSFDNINLLSELNGAIVIITCVETLDNTFDFIIFIYISDAQNYFIDSSSKALSFDTLMEFSNHTAKITKFDLDAAQNGKKYRMTLIY